MKKNVYRNIEHVMLFITLLVLGLSFYFEYAKDLQPCPLCLMQRISALLLGFCCMISLCLASLKRARVFAVLELIFAGGGLYFALRQVWLQSFANLSDTGMCMPGLHALFHYLPWDGVVKALFWGASDCGAVTWKFLGLTMASWAAGYFFIMFVLSITVLFGIQGAMGRLSKYE